MDRGDGEVEPDRREEERGPTGPGRQLAGGQVGAQLAGEPVDRPDDRDPDRGAEDLAQQLGHRGPGQTEQPGHGERERPDLQDRQPGVHVQAAPERVTRVGQRVLALDEEVPRGPAARQVDCEPDDAPGGEQHQPRLLRDQQCRRREEQA
jgi:hypothetical protein